jgi:hypothetical protein
MTNCHRLLFVLALLATGCSAQRPADSSAELVASLAPVGAADASAPAVEPAAATDPVTPAATVAVSQLGGETICEDIKLPASRIVVQRRCYTRDAAWASQAEANKEVVRRQLDELRRMDNAREQQQREIEMNRERAIMRSLIP